MLRLAFQFISDPLIAQRIEGRVRLRLWARSLQVDEPTTWAITARVVSRDCHFTRGVILPMTTGRLDQPNDVFAMTLKPIIIGPLDLLPVEVEKGDRVVLEVGSRGRATLETRDDGQTWIRFTHDLHLESPGRRPPTGPRTRRIRQCIYCFKKTPPLKREHVVPQGLNGELILQEASCQGCADITSKLEGEVLRQAFGGLRAAVGMRTRRYDERPRSLPLIVERGGERRYVSIPLKEYPAAIIAPVFPPPAHLTREAYSSGIQVRDIESRQVSGSSLVALASKHQADYVGIQVPLLPKAFARVIAKIGYGFAVFSLGLPRIAECYPLPSIMGSADEIGRWVGCEPGEPLGPKTGLHVLTMRIVDGEIRVYVRLFAQFETREYIVVVGHLA